jgi:transposase
VTAVGLIHRCFWQETTGDRMAWTADTRSDYVRPSGTYASDVTDREWALLAPLLPAPLPGGRPRTTCLRRVVNAIFYLLQAGCQWRMLPRDFPPRSTVYGYFRAWIAAGVWARVHDVLYRRSRALEGRDESPTAAIIDRCRNGRAGPDGEVGRLHPR